VSRSGAYVRWTFIVLWIVALIAAFALDRRIAQWVHDAVPVNKDARLTHRLLFVLKLPGVFWFTLAIAALLAIFHRRRFHAALALILSAGAVGLAYSIIKWIAGRHRPFKGPGRNVDPFGFHPFPRGVRGLFDPENALCFPSGHASLAFATAMCLGILMPRGRWVFFTIALITAAERVMENAHYLSDVVAGAGLGTLLGWSITREVLRRGVFDISVGRGVAEK
jgi:membrane-associated phospholipid phosphatase